jgi:oxygen-independent coproporphyrinogen-3 oxidase
MSLGIYVQVPFCQTKCTYCNFHTGPAARSLYGPYARAVAREIGKHRSLYRKAGIAESLGDETVDTIYVGGGTPSLLTPSDLLTILDAVRSHFGHDLKEVTLEADPETITAEKVAAWRAAGIDRVSMGAQSFHDTELRAAGRMHQHQDIFAAMEHLRGRGFANISLDLIAGLPHQTAESWQQSLNQLLALRPEHVSIYLLEIDEGSRLGKEALAGGSRYGAATIPDDDAMARFYELACAELAGAGYEHYEISNWALRGFRSRHNLKYWRREPYLGFGAGAHSFDGRQRWANAHDAAEYVTAIERGALPVEQSEEIGPARALDEEMFLGLRQLEGIDLPAIERQYGAHLGPRVEPLLAQGLLELHGSRLRLPPERLAVSNEVFVALLA